MKVGILIMSTLKEPSVRNILAMKETFIAETNKLMNEGKLLHQYDFIIYTGTEKRSGEKNILRRTENESHNVTEIELNETESVYRTFEKTMSVFKLIKDKYDFIIRINISCFLNIRLIDAVLGSLNPGKIYCNAINSIINPESPYVNALYPRGDFYMMSNTVLNGVIESGKELINCDSWLKNRIEVPHVDDVLIGIALIKFFGDAYHKQLCMVHYNFCPQNDIDESGLNELAISTRLKTVPPTEQTSGYSWDDNEYRKYDAIKMKRMNDIVQSKSYDGISIEKLIVPKELTRPTLFVQTVSANIYQVYP